MSITLTRSTSAVLCSSSPDYRNRRLLMRPPLQTARQTACLSRATLSALGLRPVRRRAGTHVLLVPRSKLVVVDVPDTRGAAALRALTRVVMLQQRARTGLLLLACSPAREPHFAACPPPHARHTASQRIAAAAGTANRLTAADAFPLPLSHQGIGRGPFRPSPLKASGTGAPQHGARPDNIWARRHRCWHPVSHLAAVFRTRLFRFPPRPLPRRGALAGPAGHHRCY